MRAATRKNDGNVDWANQYTNPNTSDQLTAWLRFNRSGHGSLAPWNQKVLTKRVNLLDFQLRVFPRRGQADTSTIGINLVGNFESLIKRMAKQLPHHQDDVFV